jgi:hypothetical protein
VRTSWVTAFKAAKTLKRLRPEGVRTKTRSKHQIKAKKAALHIFIMIKEKWERIFDFYA